MLSIFFNVVPALFRFSSKASEDIGHVAAAVFKASCIYGIIFQFVKNLVVYHNRNRKPINLKSLSYLKMHLQYNSKRKRINAQPDNNDLAYHGSCPSLLSELTFTLETCKGFVYNMGLILSKHAPSRIAETERVFETRRNIEGGFAQLLTNVKEVYPNIMSYEDYIRKSSEVTVPSGWNKVSFMGILKGQS